MIIAKHSGIHEVTGQPGISEAGIGRELLIPGCPVSHVYTRALHVTPWVSYRSFVDVVGIRKKSGVSTKLASQSVGF